MEVCVVKRCEYLVFVGIAQFVGFERAGEGAREVRDDVVAEVGDVVFVGEVEEGCDDGDGGLFVDSEESGDFFA